MYYENEQRIRLQGDRQKISSRKQLRQKNKIFFLMLSTVLTCMAIITICFAAKNVVVKCYYDLLENKLGNEEIYNYGISRDDSGDLHKPVLYKGDELEKRLGQLAETSKKYKYLYNHMEDYPSDILSAVCNNSDILDLALNYKGITGPDNSRFTKKELASKHTLLLQWDKRWRYAGYGENIMGMSGCAPTCMSMVCLSLVGDEAETPDQIAKYAKKAGYYLKGTGTSWSFMTEGSAHFGIKGYEISLCKSTIEEELTEGHPIICSMRAGDFTATGHFIVLSGMKDGEIIVNDPNSRQRSEKLWSYDELESQIKNLWAFSR